MSDNPLFNASNPLLIWAYVVCYGSLLAYLIYLFLLWKKENDET